MYNYYIYHSLILYEIISIVTPNKEAEAPSHCSEKNLFNGHCMNLTWLVKIHFHCKIHKNLSLLQHIKLSSLHYKILFHL